MLSFGSVSGVDLVGAAFQSRLSHNELSSLEKNLFPDVASGPSDLTKAFLEIRNKIVRLTKSRKKYSNILLKGC